MDDNSAQIVRDLATKVAEDVIKATETPLLLAMDEGGASAALSVAMTAAMAALSAAAGIWAMVDDRSRHTKADLLSVALLVIGYDVPREGSGNFRQAGTGDLHRIQKQFRAVTGLELKIPEYAVKLVAR